MSVSTIAHKLTCRYCGETHGTSNWPRSGDDVPFFFERQPGDYTLAVTCPHCGSEWYVVWDSYPGPAEPVTQTGHVPQPSQEGLSAREHHQRGYEHCQRGELDEAIAAYLEALNLDPSLDLTRQFLGEAYSRRGDLDEAVLAWEELLSRAITAAGVKSVTEGILLEARALRDERSKDTADMEAELDSYVEQLGQASQTWGVAYDALQRLGAKAVPALVAAIYSPNDLLRSRSIELLAKVGDERATAPLEGAARTDEEMFCRITGVPATTKTVVKSLMGFSFEYPISELVEEYRRCVSAALQSIRDRHPDAVPAPPQTPPTPRRSQASESAEAPPVCVRGDCMATAPLSPQAVGTGAPESQAATPMGRTTAGLIDICLYTSAGWVAVALCALLWPDMLQSSWLLVPLVVGYYAAALLFEIPVVRRYGASVGKARVGLAVASDDGRPVTPGRLLTRFALGPKSLFPYPIVILIGAISGGHSHDTVARTVIVRNGHTRCEVSPSMARTRVLIALCLAVAAGAPFLARFDMGMLRELGMVQLPAAVLVFRRWGWGWIAGVPGLAMAAVLAWLRPASPLDAVVARWSLRWMLAVAAAALCVDAGLLAAWIGLIRALVAGGT